MPCYHPIQIKKPNKKGYLAFRQFSGEMTVINKTEKNNQSMTVPCGRCIGCRLERSRQWAIRCMHESEFHEKNCFVTFTYNDKNLKHGENKATLWPRDLELFWKKLRKELNGIRIRYFACGEYGERSNRPHYHACIFGFDFPDKAFYSTKNSNNLYSSPMLDRIWSHGSCLIGSLTFESAAYVARYICDKKLGETAHEYKDMGIEPEFVRMSRRPGIGSKWFDKYLTDIYPDDFCLIRNGIKTKPPKYYDKKLQLHNPLLHTQIKKNRHILSDKNWNLTTPEALKILERVKNAQIRTLSR